MQQVKCQIVKTAGLWRKFIKKSVTLGGRGQFWGHIWLSTRLLKIFTKYVFKQFGWPSYVTLKLTELYLNLITGVLPRKKTLSESQDFLMKEQGLKDLLSIGDMAIRVSKSTFPTFLWLMVLWWNWCWTQISHFVSMRSKSVVYGWKCYKWVGKSKLTWEVKPNIIYWSQCENRQTRV